MRLNVAVVFCLNLNLLFFKRRCFDIAIYRELREVCVTITTRDYKYFFLRVALPGLTNVFFYSSMYDNMLLGRRETERLDRSRSHHILSQEEVGLEDCLEDGHEYGTCWL
jgi:hypothetical protein